MEIWPCEGWKLHIYQISIKLHIATLTACFSHTPLCSVLPYFLNNFKNVCTKENLQHLTDYDPFNISVLSFNSHSIDPYVGFWFVLCIYFCIDTNTLNHDILRHKLYFHGFCDNTYWQFIQLCSWKSYNLLHHCLSLNVCYGLPSKQISQEFLPYPILLTILSCLPSTHWNVLTHTSAWLFVYDLTFSGSWGGLL